MDMINEPTLRPGLDRFGLLDLLLPCCGQDRVALLYPKGRKGLSPGWTMGADDSRRAIAAFRDGTLAAERFCSQTKAGAAYEIVSAVRLGLVPHRDGVVTVLCVDLDDHGGDGGTVPQFASICRFLGASPITFTSKGGKGRHLFFRLPHSIPVEEFIAWSKSWGFNAAGQPEVFPKSAGCTQTWLPNEPNAQGGDAYVGGTSRSWLVSALPDPPGVRVSLETLLFLRGGVAAGGRNTALNKAAFELSQKRVSRDEAWQLCQRGAEWCGLLVEEPDATRTTFESGYEAGKRGNPQRPAASTMNDGPLELECGAIRQSPTGRLSVTTAVLVHGHCVDRLTITTTPSSRHTAVKLLHRHAPELGAPEIERLVGRVLVQAAERSPVVTAEGADQALIADILAEEAPRLFGLTYRTPQGAWSEVRQAEVMRHEFVACTPEHLVRRCYTAADAPRAADGTINRRSLIRAIEAELRVVWATLHSELPLETSANLSAASEAGRRFRAVLTAIWHRPLTFETPRTTDAVVTKASLASRAVAKAQQNDRQLELRGGRTKWQPIHDAYQAYWRPRTASVTPHDAAVPWLAMRFGLPHQVGIALPNIVDQASLNTVGRRYGVLATSEELKAAGIPDVLSGGRERLAVLSAAFTQSLLAAPVEGPIGDSDPTPFDGEAAG